MKPAYGEIIRGEVSILRGGAGGSPYLSSGSFKRATCADAPDNAISRSRNGRKRACEAMEYLIGWSKGWRLERLKRSRTKVHESKPLNRPLPLSENRELVDNILSGFGNKLKLRFLLITAPLDIRYVDPTTATQRRDHTSADGHGDVSSTASAVA